MTMKDTEFPWMQPIAIPGTPMGNNARTLRAQSLLNSLHDLITLDQEVFDAVPSARSSRVMIPLSPVAFMPGLILGKTVMVGLGQSLYVERSPKQAQGIFKRRIQDLSEIACDVDSKLARTSFRGVIDRRGSPMKEDQVHRTRKRSGGKGGSWTKGFLSRGSSRSGTPKLSVDASAKSHAGRVGGPAAPIVEIKEWLDTSGRKTSVDLVDLGKIVTEVPVGENRQSCREMDMGVRVMGRERVSSSSEVRVPGGGSEGSQLGHFFDLLELQEAAAERETEGGATSTACPGRAWKHDVSKGGETPSREHNEEMLPKQASDISTDRGQEELVTEESGASSVFSNRVPFRGEVVEKGMKAPLNASRSSPVADTGSRKVSRFKAARRPS